MNKTVFTAIIMLLSSLFSQSQAKGLKIDRIDPPHWWVGMAADTLQLMVYGPGIGDASASIRTPYPGVEIAGQTRLDSPDYLFVDVKISPDAAPGDVELRFASGKRHADVTYQLRARDRRPEDYAGFDASDVLYLIMPDRFARGGSEPDAERTATLRHKIGSDRTDPNGRHGGDIAGIRRHLDYVDSLGVTAIWVNPVLENDMPGGSYHGYATTDYYRVDPRFGSNREWNELVADAHARGLKVVMDMIFNHSGSSHPWFENRPSADWYNFADGYVQTNYRLSTIHDPYASDYDRRRTTDGWFVEAMPDLNQRNPYLMKYLIQNSIWWIEESKIDGIRMDTHPYADLEGMAQWIRAVEREYPNFNIVGECWYGNEGGEAFWQRGSKVNPGPDSELPTVMDFVLSIKAREAFNEQTDPWNGLNVVYDHLALDYLFPDPQHILTFLDNHDTDRFLLAEPDDLGSWKQAVTFLLTSRGIPQIYYGTELLMHGSKEGSDGFVRLDMPGGFEGDTVDAFTPGGRTPKQQEAFEFMQKLLQWRRGNDVIARGSLKHFMPQNGIYTYQRALPDGREVIVMMNGNDSDNTVEMDRTLEILPYGSVRRDMLTGRTVTIEPEMTFGPREILILEPVKE